MINIEKEIKRLKETYNRQGKPTSRTLDELESLIQKYPDSARRWDYRGNVILSEDDNDPRYELEDAKASYLMAIEKDPEYAIAYESLGYYYDVWVVPHPEVVAEHHLGVSLNSGDNAL